MSVGNEDLSKISKFPRHSADGDLPESHVRFEMIILWQINIVPRDDVALMFNVFPLQVIIATKYPLKRSRKTSTLKDSLNSLLEDLQAQMLNFVLN